MIRHTLSFELRTLARNKRARLFTIAFPVLLLVVLSGLSSGADHVTVDGESVAMDRFFLPGILAMSTVTSCFAGLVQVIVGRRHMGIYKRRRATPVPAHVLVVAQCLASSAMAAVSALVLLVVAGAAFGIGVSAAGLVAIALTVVVGALSLCAVAFAVAAAIPSPDAAQPVVQLVMFPVLFVSGIWFPADELPGWLDAVAQALPVAHVSHAMHRAVEAGSLGDALSVGDLAVLVAWAAGAALLAARRFSWLPSTATA